MKIYKKIAKEENRGFTLIELLVVIAIISLLSTVVLASLDDARIKGRNSKRSQMAVQYINALEMYRDDHTEYPKYGGAGDNWTHFVCIGEWKNDKCFATNIVNDNFNTALKKYIAGPPANNEPGVAFNGTIYGCLNPACTAYELDWILEKEVDCNVMGAKSNYNISGYKWCYYRSSAVY